MRYKTILVTVLTTTLFVSLGNAKAVYVKRKALKTPTQSCEKAYQAAKSSPTMGTVEDATENCEKAAQALCIEYVKANSDGPDTGDGRLIAANCDLTAAYGGNKAVNQGKATANCEKSHKNMEGGVAKGDVQEAAGICSDEMNKSCEKMVNDKSDGPNTGDGRLVGASCSLLAAHGAFVEVARLAKVSATKSSGTAAASSSCGAK